MKRYIHEDANPRLEEKNVVGISHIGPWKMFIVVVISENGGIRIQQMTALRTYVRTVNIGPTRRRTIPELMVIPKPMFSKDITTMDT